MIRIGLSFIVGLSCWFGRLEAQTPAEPEVVQAVNSTPAGRITPMATRDGGPVRDCFNRHGYCCGQSLDWYGCGGWRTQCTFVFGSCRTFFGEPCLPKQPRPSAVYGGLGR